MEPEISIVVPLHNEGANVEPLARAILSVLRSEKTLLELILVDDGSTDDTAERIRKVQRSEPCVRGLRHLKNAGQSAALWTGFKASRGDVICTLDGDLQNDPADLPGMLGELGRFDLVCGVRAKRMDNWVRRVSARIARLARKLVLGVDFQDTGCNLRVFKRRVLETIVVFDGFHRFMPVLAQRAGSRVCEIAVAHHPRIAGESKYGVGNRLGRGIYDLLMVRWLLKRQLSRLSARELGSAGVMDLREVEEARLLSHEKNSMTLFPSAQPSPQGEGERLAKGEIQ